MPRRQNQKGFTLVELAISLTIIGLLIGGVLKGRQLMENARVAAALSQVAAVKAGVATFQGTYNGLPGDLKNAGIRIPDCRNCTVDPTGHPWIGNGFVGLPDWNLRMAPGQGDEGLIRPPISEKNETLLFWAELVQAGLFSGIPYNGEPVGRSAAEFGVHAPEARIGGGWIVGQANGDRANPQPLAVSYLAGFVEPVGLFMVLAPDIITGLNATQGAQVLVPLSAAAIDDKIDDGKALTGGVVAYGFNSTATTSGCFEAPPSGAPPTPASYNEAIDSQDCGLFVQINN